MLSNPLHDETPLAARAYTVPGYYDNAAFLCTVEWIKERGNSFPFDEEGIVEIALPPLAVPTARLTWFDKLRAMWVILRTDEIQLEVG